MPDYPELVEVTFDYDIIYLKWFKNEKLFVSAAIRNKEITYNSCLNGVCRRGVDKLYAPSHFPEVVSSFKSLAHASSYA